MKIRRYLLFSCLCIIILATTSPTAFASEKPTEQEYETGVYYKVRKGDTLWDISERFFDSPVLWPEVWRENKQISNPHWIYPGDQIRLYRDLSDFEIETDEPEAATVPIPEEPPKPAYFIFKTIDRTGFIKKSPLKASGSIFKAQDDQQLIETGDTIYIRKLSDDAFDPGSRFTIYRTIRQEEMADSDFKGGIQHYLLGVAEITLNESQYAMAKIVQSYRTIRTGDLLIPYKQRSSEIILAQSKENVTGKIICSEENSGIMGDHTIAFIDKGEQHGIIPGQRYHLFYQEKMRESPKNPKEIQLSPIDIGTIFILHTEDETSTVLITSAHRAIKPGAKFRTP